MTMRESTAREHLREYLAAHGGDASRYSARRVEELWQFGYDEALAGAPVPEGAVAYVVFPDGTVTWRSFRDSLDDVRRRGAPEGS